MTNAHRMMIALAMVLSAAPLARAQTPAQSVAWPPEKPPQGVNQQAPPPSAEALGVSLRAIRQEYKQAPLVPMAEGAELRYDFYVDVVGKRPPIEFFKDFDLSTYSAVKWGGVTHLEILNAVTPFPFRHYGAGVDLLSLLRKK